MLRRQQRQQVEILSFTVDFLAHNGQDLVICDKKSKHFSLQDLLSQQVLFVCVITRLVFT